MRFAIAKYDTPVFNIPDPENIYGGNDGKTLKFNDSGLVKELEFVAYSETVFEIIDEIPKQNYSVYNVICREYGIILNGRGLFIDSRFTETTVNKPEPRSKIMPTKENIYNYFDSSLDVQYVWGGNNKTGVDMMKQLYPPPDDLSEEIYNHWIIKGVDCSGLIYEATEGYTPRNTHQLVNYGKPVLIEGLAGDEIITIIEPLDMIVWKGHVVFVYDKNTTIESSHSAGGVIKKKLEDALKNILSLRKPSNEWIENEEKIFVIKRWIDM